MKASRTTVLFCSVLVLCAGVFLVLSSLKPISSADFWWHLETGEYIVTHKELPSEDIFTHTDPDVDTVRERVILTSYWLVQSIYYLLYRIAGFGGIIALRFVFILAVTVVVLWRALRAGAGWFLALLATALAVLSLGNIYSFDRPQIFSFLFTAVLVGMMEQIMRGNRPHYPGMILLMMIWANVHGAFVVGDVLLGIFGIAYWFEHRKEPARWRPAALWSLVGIAVSLVNPNTYETFIVALTFQEGYAVKIMEYNDSFTSFFSGTYGVAILWVLVLLGIVGVVLSKRRSITEIMLLGAVSFLALRYTRNTAFFTVAMSPMVVSYIARAVERFRLSGLYLRAGQGVATVAVVASTVLFSSSVIADGAPLNPLVSRFYPAQAVEFLQSSGIRGRMYNDYDWGGYLIWRLYPSYQVFIDGRGLYREVYDDYFTAGRASMEPRGNAPEYQVILDRYEVNFTLQRVTQKNGTLQPLMKRLLMSPEWIPVYLDNNAFVLARSGHGNDRVIAAYGIPKELFLSRLMEFFDTNIQNRPQDARYYLGKAELMAFLGQKEQAKALFRNVLSIDPGNALARELLDFLEKRK